MTDFLWDLVALATWDGGVLSTAWEYVRNAVEQHAPTTWAEAKKAFELLVYFLAAIAAIGVVLRIKRLIELVREIREGRSSIWDLRGVADSFRSDLAEMRQAKDEMNAVLAQIREFNFKESLDAVQRQLIDLQRGAADDTVLVSQTAVTADVAATNNWEEIKSIWTDVRDKLEEIIERADGRKARKYRDINRRDYRKVIDTLLADNLINKAVADDASYMNDTYLSFRNQKNPITDSLRQKFAERRRRLDQELASFKPPPPAKPSSRTTDVLVPPPQQVSKSNGHHSVGPSTV